MCSGQDALPSEPGADGEAGPIVVIPDSDATALPRAHTRTKPLLNLSRVIEVCPVVEGIMSQSQGGTSRRKEGKRKDRELCTQFDTWEEKAKGVSSFLASFPIFVHENGPFCNYVAKLVPQCSPAVHRPC